MPYLPAIPLAPSKATSELVAKGWMGHALVKWPRGEDHRPVMRGLLRTVSRDSKGVEQPFLQVVPISLTGPRDLTRFAEVETRNWGQGPRRAVLFDDGDGHVFTTPVVTKGPGVSRDVAKRELDYLAARLLGPDPGSLRQSWDEPFHDAKAAGIPVTTLEHAETEGLLLAEILRNRGIEINPSREAADAYALNIASLYAWTGDVIATRDRVPRWLVTCEASGRIRLVCCAGWYSPDWVAAATFGLDDGARAEALARRIEATVPGARLRTLGKAELTGPLPEPLDGAFETAAAMLGKLRHLLRIVIPLLPTEARSRAEAFVAATRQQQALPDAAAATAWWGHWHALSAALPENLSGSPEMAKLAIVRVVLDGSGYGTALPRVPEVVPIAPERTAKPPIRLALDSLEFSTLAQAKAIADPGPFATLLRDVSSATSDMSRYIAHGGMLYRTVWQEAFDAGVDLRAERSPEGLRRLAKALSVLRQADPAAFPDVPDAAHWAMAMRPRLLALSVAANRMAEEPVEQPPAPAPVPPVAVAPFAQAEPRVQAEPKKRPVPPPRAIAPRPVPEAQPAPLVAERGPRRPPPPRAVPDAASPVAGAVPAPSPVEPVSVAPPADVPVPQPVPVEPPAPLDPVPPVVPETVEAPAPGKPEEPAPAPVPAEASPSAAEAPPSEREPDPVAAIPPQAGEGRTKPTRNGLVVLAAMADHPAMRKTDIAELAGIGRGAANRTVDRLVADGWMVKVGVNRFGIAPAP